MKTAYELLMSAPDDQVTRCKIVMRAIIAGNWEDAAFTLTAAANEATGDWAADAKALVNAIERLLQSPEERKKYAQAGLARVNSVFSWKKAAQEVAEVYREAIHGYRRSS